MGGRPKWQPGQNSRHLVRETLLGYVISGWRKGAGIGCGFAKTPQRGTFLSATGRKIPKNSAGHTHIRLRAYVLGGESATTVHGY